MLKKMTALFVALTLVFTGFTAFAEKPTANATKDTPKVNEQQAFRSGVEALKPLTDAIKANNEQITALRGQAKTALEGVKGKIEALRDKKESLTPVQLEKVRAIIASIKEGQKLLASTTGKIVIQTAELRKAKKDRNLEAYKAALNNIIAVQTTRKTNLQKLITDMNNLLLVQI